MTEFRTVNQLAAVANKAFPGFVRKGRMLILPPVRHLLRAVIFDSSGFSKSAFYPTAFVQPLYQGKDYFFLTFGGRLRSRENVLWDLAKTDPATLWDALTTAIGQQALPFL